MRWKSFNSKSYLFGFDRRHYEVSQENAIAFGFAGPNLRASGVDLVCERQALFRI